MRPLTLTLALPLLLLLTACPYESRVDSISDDELCRNLGIYTLKEHQEGVRITREEIERRNLDRKQCIRTANSAIDEFRPAYKQDLCGRLAVYHYEGEYPAFKQTLDKIHSRGFADQECVTIAEFRLRKMEREREERRAIAATIRETSEEMFGRGSHGNPVNIRIQNW